MKIKHRFFTKSGTKNDTTMNLTIDKKHFNSCHGRLCQPENEARLIPTILEK